MPTGLYHEKRKDVSRMKNWQEMNGSVCRCGRVHKTDIQVLSGKGVLAKLPEVVKTFGAGKAFVLADPNTWSVEGQRVCALLQQAGLSVVSHVLADRHPVPDEKSVGAVMMAFDPTCELIIGVGSGVLNDLGKLVSWTAGKPYIIVATAPSMDGYASASSSMERGGLKVSLATRAADVILGDSEILCTAPMEMMAAGLGDMLAKYISICEWRIAHLLLGEYYCEEIAQLIRDGVRRCVDNADGLLRGEEEAVLAVFEGLVAGGIAMNYAGLSRPASGVEHYISHVLDMRGVSLGTPTRLHGLQCAAGTCLSAGLYEKLLRVKPDREKALAFVEGFDYESHKAMLRRLLGESAEAMIEQEARERKYDKSTHPARLEKILDHWEEILQIIREEVPPAEELERLLDRIGAPRKLSDLGTDDALLPQIFAATRDIRDKYVLSRLCWDLGITEELL